MIQKEIAGHNFWIREGVPGLYDERMIKPVLADEYKLEEIKRAKHSVQYIADIGSHVGSFTIAAKRLFPTAHIIAADPEATACECYRKNTAHLSNVYLHEVAIIGENVDTVSLRQTGLFGDKNPASNFVVEIVQKLNEKFTKESFGFEDELWNLKERMKHLPIAVQEMAEKYFQENFDKDKIEKSIIQVKATRLETLLQTHEFPYLDILKIDAEGSEASILQGLAESGWLKKTKWLRFEWHHEASLPLIKKAIKNTHKWWIDELPMYPGEKKVQGFGLAHNILDEK